MNTPEASSRLPDAAEVRQRLDAFRARRGYLLPHQGAMAAALPDLQDAYGPFYKTLILDLHHLGAFEREFVWLALLTAAKEAVGTHHLDLFFKNGGTERQGEASFRLVSWALGSASFRFLERHWQPYFPSVPARQAYHDGKAALLASFDGALSEELAQLALLAVYAAHADHWGLQVEIERCYHLGLSEAKMAEAFSLVMWPCGVNRFLEACDIWVKVMNSGKVTPSAPFKAWAEQPDQQGFALTPRGAVA
ncbi:MAG: hypothetical protein Q8K31_06420 [Burkholderiaceae bacterium]|nr:hypothetical protein [Burkholderiaceae bacterium]MDP1968804.1 hypothetical protein [Burkholderiaceae bacterium]